MFSQSGPGYARPRPPGQGRGVDAQGCQVNGLLATEQQQLGFARVRCPGRLVLHQDIGRAAQVSMLNVKCDLVR